MQFLFCSIEGSYVFFLVKGFTTPSLVVVTLGMSERFSIYIYNLPTKISSFHSLNASHDEYKVFSLFYVLV